MKTEIFKMPYKALTEAVLLMTFVSMNAQVEWISTTNRDRWVTNKAKLTKSSNKIIDVVVTTQVKEQTVDGFGACFNELGWTALSVLDEKKREIILKDLFDPIEGLKLNICRMPVGANDYSRNYYSLNDSVGDLEMKYFSIARDKGTLIPYIKAAMKYRPDLKIWGSPWCPPYWMKTNNHYACSPGSNNGLTKEQKGEEGTTQFRMQPEYLKAYALYFTKYIQSYRNEGIHLTGVNVQNEMNSCQNFPSCIWTATDLGNFIGKYLGPAFKETIPDAEIWYGTYERPTVEQIDTILQNPVTSKYISGVSFQWAGKKAIPGVHAKYADLKLMQSETECGYGRNDWKDAEYTFSLMKHYFENGVSVYSFWNSILDETGKSMWGWKQNSMITINSSSKEVVYNPEFYLLKHFSYYIQPGAKKVKTEGNNSELLAFLNPDNSLILIVGNTEDAAKQKNIQIGKKALIVQIQPHSFNTFKINKF
jgi:glucosylceramidase